MREPTASHPARPLAGLRVVEASGDIAVRYAGRLFSTLGAKVVRVGGSPTADVFSAWLDQEKSFAASLQDALAAVGEGERRTLVIAGQTQADVQAAREKLSAFGAPATLVALTWFDRRGPYADWKANDPIIQAMTGVAYSFGEPQGPPILAQGVAPQVVAGLTAFIAALASLMDEERPVAEVETSIFEAALCFAETGAVGAEALGWVAHRLGVNRFAPSYPCRIYRAADGDVGVTVLTPQQWAAFTGLIGRPDLGAEPAYRTTVQRLVAADELDEILVPIFRERPAAYWVERGEALRIPMTPAPPPGALPSLPHWRGRGSFEPIGEGGVEAPGQAFRFTFEGERSPRPPGGAAGPLAGVRVADFSMGWAGPLATRYLGDLGADVLKIESTARPDWWRGWEVVPAADPPPTELPRNFMAVNRSKRGLDLDLALPRDLAAAQAIVQRSDIVIDNQGPGVMDKLGLGPADQRRLNPRTISISMAPFGRSGPLAGIRAYGSTVEQACGMPFVNGREDWDPCQQHVAYGDPVAGLYAAAAALTGLFARERLGGAEVDLCQVECLFQLGADAIIAEQVKRARVARTGSRRAGMAPCCVVRGRGEEEAWLAVTIGDDNDAWRGLCRVMGRADLAADPEFASVAGRRRREDEIEAAVAAWAETREPREAAEALQEAGVAAGPVIPTHELFADAQLWACDYWAPQHRRYIGEHFTPRPPFRFDGARPAVIRAAPVLGEHTEEVLAELGIERGPRQPVRT